MDEQFSEHITWFQKHIDSRRRMLPLFVGMAGKMASRVRKDLFEFVDEHCKDIERYENGDPHKFKVPVELNNRYRQLRGFHSDSSVFFNLLPRMTFISLVSIYDAYLSRLLKLIFKIRPEILNSSERQFSFKDINDFDSFDDMKEATIEAEVESFLRKGHVEQIKWLENKLSSSTKKLNLRSGLKNWGIFVELTERRNLLVHNDGIVSKNYIKVCNDNNISCNKAIGEQLDIDSEYYKEACNCINEIGAKLGHVLWRKLKPTNESCQKADDNLIELIFNLLISKDYDLAIKLCELVEFKSFRVTTQQSLFYIKINHAIALKGLEKQNDCEKLLDQIDFTPLSDILKIANYVLREQNEDAAEIMYKLSTSDEFDEGVYKTWPLFQWFIKTDEFNEAYKIIYGEQFTISGNTSESDSSEESQD